MALPFIEGVFRVTFNWTGANGTSAANVLHFQGGSVTPEDVHDALLASVVANMFNSVAQSSILSTVDILPLDGVSATQTFVSPATALWRGETVSEALFADATLVKLRTGERGRSKRGRIYLPFLAEGAMITGTIAAGSLAAMQAAWDTFAANMDAAAIPLGVASYKLAVWTPLTGLQVEGATGVQRRRQSRFRRSVGF
jgi:hypothetical protein